MKTNIVTLDRATRAVLVVIAVLLAVIAVELWQLGPHALPAAQAQIPDSGMQRYQLLSEVQTTNQLLKDVLSHLRTKAVKVKIDATDKLKDAGRQRTGG